MPAIANIVIADNVPANHTFKPLSASLPLSTWAETTATTYNGNSRLAVSMSNPSSSRKTTRIKAVLSLPIERTVDGIVVVDDTILYTVEAVIPATCSAVEALKAYALFKNLSASTVMQSFFADREPVY